MLYLEMERACLLNKLPADTSASTPPNGGLAAAVNEVCRVWGKVYGWDVCSAMQAEKELNHFGPFIN
jgi:hypothetical protein